MKPNERNFCGGGFSDWLEVALTERCNGKCAWCIDRKGWHPEEHADTQTLINAILGTGKQNISLLGGEPTLYPDLKNLIEGLASNGLSIYLTTNGGLLTPAYANEYLKRITQLNISTHTPHLVDNVRITGIRLYSDVLKDTIEVLHQYGVKVRFNCNVIRGHMDNHIQVKLYIANAKSIGVDEVRFAELKDSDKFVNLYELFGDQYGINDDPYSLGCWSEGKIDGMKITFRQMCGFQTPFRPKPENPERLSKQVLYYDGTIYDGWQYPGEEVIDVTDKELIELLTEFKEDKKNITETAIRLIKEGLWTTDKNYENLKSDPIAVGRTRSPGNSTGTIFMDSTTGRKEGGGCQY